MAQDSTTTSTTSKPLYRAGWRSLGYFLAFFVASLSLWLHLHFGRPTIQQILFHLHFADTLIFDADEFFVSSFAIHCLLAPLLLACLCIVAEKVLRQHASLRGIGSKWLGAPILRRTSRYLPGVLLFSSALVLTEQVSAFGYLKSRFGPDIFAARYVGPSDVAMRATDLKNLVLIYVEGLDAAYSDRELFGVDLLAELNKFDGVSFDYQSAPGTSWTIGGIVGTQCGVPLQIVTRVGRENGENVNEFLPGAQCLGDILQKFGYRNVFIGGAPLAFAGKGKFLTRHHYDEVYGYYEFLRNKVPLRTVSPWGLYDDDLFAQARAKLKELHESGERFNLTVLTLDTHHPEGHYSRYCLDRGAQTFEDIVRCSSHQVAEFVRHIVDAGYLRDTNVVIIGDHLAMPNPVIEKLETASPRTIFNRFLTNYPVSKAANYLLPFDMFPTIVEFIGIDIEGDRLGLGFSGFGTDATELGPRPEGSPEILNFSRKYESLWVTESDDPR